MQIEPAASPRQEMAVHRKNCIQLLVIASLALCNILLFYYRKHTIVRLKTSPDLLLVRETSPVTSTTTTSRLNLHIERNHLLNESDALFLRKSIGARTELRLKRIARENIVRQLRDLQRNASFDGAIPADISMEVMKREGYASRLPDVILIGAKKCGTNALKFYLEFHPQMCVTGYEVHYYDRYDKHNVSWYESRLAIPRKDQLLFEKTPRYFVTKSAPRNMKRELPGNIKFILLVRDPVKRLLSDFRFTAIMRTKRQWRMRQSTKLETERFTAEVTTNGLTAINGSSPFVYTGDYALHFKEWLKYFDRSQFLIIDNSDMKRNLLGTLQSVEQFVGLDPLYTREMFTADGLGVRVEARTVRSITTDDETFPHPVISDRIERMLRDYYRPKNEEFEQLVGAAFPWTLL